MAEHDDPRSSRGEDTSGRPTTRSTLSPNEATQLKDILGAATLAGYNLRVESGRDAMEQAFTYLRQMQKIPGHVERMEKLAELDTDKEGKIGQLCDSLEQLLHDDASVKKWRARWRAVWDVVWKGVLGVLAASSVGAILGQLGSWGTFTAWLSSLLSRGGPPGGGH